MSTAGASVGERSHPCPSCGETGHRVKAVTVRSLLRPESLRRMTDVPYRFCATPTCETVYFPERHDERFSKADLTVRVGIKEAGAPRPICYCFDHSIEEIEDEVRRTGRTSVPDDIKERIKAACWCETKNPEGTCCLGRVNHWARESMERSGKRDQAVKLSSGIEAEDAGDRRPPHAAQDTTAPTARRARYVERVARAGTLVSAVVASACCWLPLLLVAAGVSGVTVSATFERFRPIFMGLTFIFLGAAFYLTYRPRRAAALASCEGEACSTAPGARPAAAQACCPPHGVRVFTVRGLNKVMLWVVTVVALAFVFFPNYAGVLLGGRRSIASPGDQQRVVVAIQGMTCEACAASVEKALTLVPGVTGAEVSFARGEAVVAIAGGNKVPLGEILDEIARAGYAGRLVDISKRRLGIAGMTCAACAACAAQLQARLARVPGVRSASVSYREAQAVLEADASVTVPVLERAVLDAGYRLVSASDASGPDGSQAGAGRRHE